MEDCTQSLVDRLCIPREYGGRGLLVIEDCVRFAVRGVDGCVR